MSADDAGDNLSSSTDPGTFAESYAFDALNRIVQITDRNNGNTLTPRNDSDLMTAFTDPRAITTSFTYNGFGDPSRARKPRRRA